MNRKYKPVDSIDPRAGNSPRAGIVRVEDWNVKENEIYRTGHWFVTQHIHGTSDFRTYRIVHAEGRIGPISAPHVKAAIAIADCLALYAE